MQQETMIENTDTSLLLMKIVDQINQSKKTQRITKKLPAITAKPVKNVSRLLELEIVKGRSFGSMEEKWAFEERLARGHKQ